MPTFLNKTSIEPKLTLVGAGPGDPDLITVKGLNALSQADVVLYDALVHPALLEHTPENAKLVFVGKRKGQKSVPQETTNRLIVEYALQYGHVVRLKGGDPFIFARGHEEMEHAEAFDIPVEVVPGLSSATALPALQGIPVTRRGISESFWVVTATTKEGALSHDVALAAQSTATVVYLMGLGKLEKIVGLYQQFGKGDLPITIIQNGSLEDEQTLSGTINDILPRKAESSIGTPAVIVVGEAVALKDRLSEEVLIEKLQKAS